MTDDKTSAPELPRVEPMTHRQEVAALRQMTRHFDRMSASGRRAAIYWLADYYLGIKWWGR